MSSNNYPPQASLLGLPTELRNQIYEYIFISKNKTSLHCENVSWHFRYKLLWDYYSTKSTYHDHHPLRRLHVDKRPNSSANFVLMGSESGNKDDFEHFAALFAVPCICRTIRGEVMPVLAGLPPISQIRFVFQDFTRGDMESWVGMIGEKNVASMRKWVLHGTRPCQNEQYRDGHLWKGFRNGEAPCSYHTDARKLCNRGCSADSRENKGMCPRRVEIELDRRLVSDEASSGSNVLQRDEAHEDGYCIAGCHPRDRPSFWPSREGLQQATTSLSHADQTSSADDVVRQVRSRLSDDLKAARDALMLTRHVVVAPCLSTYIKRQLQCTDERVVDSIISTTRGIEVSNQALIDMAAKL